MQKKKQIIGIDIRDLKIAKTGAHTYLSELCKAINNKQDLQFQYVFLDTRLPIYTGSHKIGKLWEQINYVFWKQVTLPIKAWLNGCRLVFCTDYFGPYTQLSFTTIPVFHDAFFWEYPAHYNKYWLWFFNTLGVSAAKKSSAIVTVTNYAKQQIATYSGIDAAKIIPIHIGPKSSIIEPQQKIDPHSSNNNWQQLLQKKYILHDLLDVDFHANTDRPTCLFESLKKFGFKYIYEETNNEVSDHHPGEKGHETIFRLFYEYITKWRNID
jgi:hypothetical protein